MKLDQKQATAKLAAVILFTAGEIYGEERHSENSRILISIPDKTLTLIVDGAVAKKYDVCLLYTSPSPRDGLLSRMPSSA